MKGGLVLPANSPRLTFRLSLPVIVIIAAFMSGCSSNQGTLHLVSVDGRHEFAQTFSQAYYDRNEAGDADIVLVEDDIQISHPDPTKPLAPDHSLMPRQLVHIRVFWTPMTGVKPDHPANTNASVHWCLVCDNTYQPGVVVYRGSGLVEIDDSSDGAQVTIRKAWMKVGSQHGQLVDPLGPSIMAGSFYATRNAEEVKAILAEMKAAAGPGAPIQANSEQPDQPKHLAANSAN
jgi:hypothetical protein